MGASHRARHRPAVPRWAIVRWTRLAPRDPSAGTVAPEDRFWWARPSGFAWSSTMGGPRLTNSRSSGGWRPGDHDDGALGDIPSEIPDDSSAGWAC